MITRGRGSGTFDITLRDDTPQAILDACTLVGTQVFVGPMVAVNGMSDAGLLAAFKAANAYGGVILDRPDPFTLSGADLSWYIGQPDGPSPTVSDTGIALAGSKTTTQWIDAILPSKGLTKGTVTNGTAIVNGVIPPLSASPLAAIQWVCAQSDVEYRINCDGTVDVGPSTTLYPNPSASTATVITRGQSGREGDLKGVQATSLARRRNAWDVASRAVAAYEGTSAALKFVTATQTPEGVDWVDFAGTAYGNRDIYVDAEVLPTAAKAQYIANITVALTALDQREVTLTSATHNVIGNVLPGERVFFYDPLSGLYDLAGTQVRWRGQIITPVVLRVAEVSYPIVPGMGVYLRRAGVWTDISRFVVHEDGDVTWIVTANGFRLNASPIGRGLITIPIGDAGTQTSALARVASRGATSSSDTGGAGWTPSITNWSIGTGGSAATTGEYSVAGGLMTMEVISTIGTTGAGRGASSNPLIAMPSGWQLRFSAGATVMQYGTFRIVANGGEYQGVLEGVVTNPERLRVRWLDAAARQASLSSTLPAAWTSGDGFSFTEQLPVERV